MHWLFWQHARKRRIRSLDRCRQQALAELDAAEMYYRLLCERLGLANKSGTKKITLSQIAYARQEVRLAGQRALKALDELNEAKEDR